MRSLRYPARRGNEVPADCLRRYQADILEQAYMNCIEDQELSGS